MTDAYAAGLIDGEGCIYIDKGYTLRIDVGMTERALPVLRSLEESFGGRVRKSRDDTDRWQAAWTWTVIGTDCARVLERLLPHLRLKHEQARLALRVQALRGEMPLNRFNRPGWTPDLRERAERMRTLLMGLNRKGPMEADSWTPGAFARLVDGVWVTPQLDLLSDLGYETLSGPWPSSGSMRNGECWTADTSESPNEGAACSSLPDVLVADCPPRFSLSPRAAAGILRRAEKRGRELPRHLARALTALASTHPVDGRKTT